MPPTSNKDTDWKSAWQPVVEQIGSNLADDEITWGPNDIEAGPIRRWLEPLEFDCALHCDQQQARQFGYNDIVAPYTSLASFTLAPLWSPGDTLFDNDKPHAQPLSKALRPRLPPEAPEYSGYFATDIELEFLREVEVGERLGRRGHRLVDCVPKETRVGRGAFLTFETETISSRGDVVVRMRSSLFCYTPHLEKETST